IALSVPRPQPTPGSLTIPQLQEGGKVTIRQPFILKFGTDDIPVKIVFDSAWLTTTHEYYEAESGYKFLIVQLTAQNIGKKEVVAFNWLDKWEVTVDKGYLYMSKSQPWMARLRPEEKKTEQIIFEILQETSPVEVKYYRFLSASQSVTLNLKGYDFPTKTVTAKESLTIWSYEWPKGGTLTIRIKNYGSVSATIDKVYIDELLAYDEDILVKPGASVEIRCINPAGLSLRSNNSYKVKIVTVVGNTFESTVYYK
ncbi:MAG: hypothetical protein QXV46_07540, partial [Candidatus Bathyarchaeia archaeon]